MKILIVKRDKIGDMLLMTPMLEHLRARCPNATIHVLANDYNAWVLEGHPALDKLWVYPRFRHGNERRWSALWYIPWQNIQLRRERYDAVIAAGGVVSPRAIKRIMALGGKRSIAYSDQTTAQMGLTDPVAFDRNLHEVQSNLRLLETLGIAAPTAPIYPQYQLPKQWREHGAQWLRAQGIGTKEFVVIGINARRAKRKPTHQQVLRWAERLYQQYQLHTVFLWQPGEENNRLYPGDDQNVGALLEHRPAYLHPLRSEESLLAVLGVIWHARTTIVPDGGLAHLSSVSPGGVLALFAETDVSPHPDNWRPYSPRGCYLEAPKMVSELTDEAVFEKVDWLLGLHESTAA